MPGGPPERTLERTVESIEEKVFGLSMEGEKGTGETEGDMLATGSEGTEGSSPKRRVHLRGTSRVDGGGVEAGMHGNGNGKRTRHDMQDISKDSR